MPVVDVHTHFLPMEFVELLREGEGPAGVEVADREGAEPLIVHDNGLRYPVLDVFHDVDAKLAQMDRDGIDVSLISLTPSLFLYWIDPAETARVHRTINDAGAALAAASGGRLRALATVPMNDPPAAAEELRRARELGLMGVEIGTSVADTMLDDPALEPFFAAAEELSMPVMLHPYVSMVSPPDPGVRGYHLSNVIGNPFETFVAAARLIVGGVFDRHPGLTVQLVHAGGALPYQLGRLDHAFEVRSETKERIARAPSSYLDRFLFDTVIFDRRAFDLLLALAGPERVVFGTDIPFDMADAAALEWVEGEDRQAVLGGNAARAYALD